MFICAIRGALVASGYSVGVDSARREFTAVEKVEQRLSGVEQRDFYWVMKFRRIHELDT